MTVADLVTRCLQDLKVLQAGETADADNAELGRVTLNDWIDALATDNLTFYTITRTTWALTPNVASYTIGTGATISVPRPVNPQMIAQVGYVYSALETLVPLLTDAEYQAILYKTTTALLPTAFYYNPTYGASGYGTLFPLPIPTGAPTGVIYTPLPVSEYTATTTVIGIPPGYRRFYRTNLAVELASAFDATVSPELQRAAMESRTAVRKANQRINEMSCGEAARLFSGTGTDNIYADLIGSWGGSSGTGWTQ